MRVFLMVMAFGLYGSLLAQNSNDPILFRYWTEFELDKKKAEKAQRSIDNCGYDFEYDQTSRQLILKIYDIRHLPVFLKRGSDGLTLHANDQVLALHRKDIHQQLILHFKNISDSLQLMAYQKEMSHFLDTVMLPVRPNAMDLRERYRFFADQISEAPVSQARKDRLQKSIAKIYNSHQHQAKSFNRFLRGKITYTGRSFYSRHYAWPVRFPMTTFDPEFQITFTTYKQDAVKLKFDTLSGQPTAFITEHEQVECEPFNRYTYFKKLKGLQLKKLQYTPYQPPQQQIGYRSFEIFFDRNQSDCDYQDIEEIIHLMQDSAYTIKKAKITAYASVEGPAQINHRLQKERAQLLINLLREYNRDSIELVSLKTAENWQRFYQQLPGSAYQHWQVYDQARIKQELTHAGILHDWEDSLFAQRKAVLDLMLYKEAEPDFQVQDALQEYQKQQSAYLSIIRRGKFDENLLRPYLLKLLALEDFLKAKIREGVISAGKLCELQHIKDPGLDLMWFYSLMLESENGASFACENQEQLVLNARYALQYYLQQPALHKNRKLYFQRQAYDLMVYAFEQIDKGNLSAEIICQLSWPDEPVFYPFTLMELDYVNKHIPEDTIKVMSCYRLVNDEEEESLPNGDPDNIHAISFAAPLEYRLPHNDYYFLLKKKLLHQDKAIRRLTIRSDDILEFDLYEFLSYNILNWDVWNNVYFDDEVDYQEMVRQMKRLFEVHDILCTSQMYQLYLDLHLRIGYLLKHDATLDKEVLESLEKLSRYYQKNMAHIDHDDAMKLVRHLLWMGKH